MRKEDRINELVMEFIREMTDTTPEKYLEIKLILNAANSGKPEVAKYLDALFKYLENHRPLLIEMKGCTTA